MATLRVKRGTRAQLDTAATSGWLETGEPYLITDENRLAVGTSASSFEAMAKQSEAGGTPLTGSTSISIISNEIRRAALTGDVTAAANSNNTTIANNVVTNAKMADMAAGTLKGRASTMGTGDPQDLTPLEVRTAIGFDAAVKNVIPDCVAGGDGVIVVTTGPGNGTGVEVSAVDERGGGWRRAGSAQWEGTHFYTTTAGETPPFTLATALSSGTDVYSATRSARILRSSATANSGRTLRTRNNPRALQTDFSFRAVVAPSSTYLSRACLSRFGFMTSASYSATETIGCAIDITTTTGNLVTVTARGNGTTTAPLVAASSTATAFGGLYYSNTVENDVILDIDRHATGAVFTVSDRNGLCYGWATLADPGNWSTHNALIGVKATHGGTVAGDITAVDYMGLGPARPDGQQRPLCMTSASWTLLASPILDAGLNPVGVQFEATLPAALSDPMAQGPYTAHLHIVSQLGASLPTKVRIAANLASPTTFTTVAVSGSMPGDSFGNVSIVWYVEWTDGTGKWMRSETSTFDTIVLVAIEF